MNLNQKIRLSRKRIEKIREKFNESKNRFSKSKIKEIRRILYKIKKQKNLATPEIKEIEINLLELEKNVLNQESIIIMMILNVEEQEMLKICLIY